MLASYFIAFFVHWFMFTGEEDSLEDQLPPRSPAPNYESLKKDTQEFTRRVQDFFAAGKVIKEKVTDQHSFKHRRKPRAIYRNLFLYISFIKTSELLT